MSDAVYNSHYFTPLNIKYSSSTNDHSEIHNIFTPFTRQKEVIFESPEKERSSETKA